MAIRLAGPHVLYVKRVVGLPGERLTIVRGPGVRQRRSPRSSRTSATAGHGTSEEVTLTPREYFVIGDNRGMSAGDHDFGRVDVGKIAGKVVF